MNNGYGFGGGRGSLGDFMGMKMTSGGSGGNSSSGCLPCIVIGLIMLYLIGKFG